MITILAPTSHEHSPTFGTLHTGVITLTTQTWTEHCLLEVCWIHLSFVWQIDLENKPYHLLPYTAPPSLLTPKAESKNHITPFPYPHPAVAPTMLRIKSQHPQQPMRPCRIWTLLISLPSSPFIPLLLIVSSMQSPVYQAHSCLRAFALSAPSAWNAFSLTFQSVDSSLVFMSWPPS